MTLGLAQKHHHSQSLGVALPVTRQGAVPAPGRDGQNFWELGRRAAPRRRRPSKAWLVSTIVVVGGQSTLVDGLVFICCGSSFVASCRVM